MSRRLANLDLKETNPELEAELLKAVQGPHAPYSHQEMEAIPARAVEEEREHHAPPDG